MLEGDFMKELQTEVVTGGIPRKENAFVKTGAGNQGSGSEF